MGFFSLHSLSYDSIIKTTEELTAKLIVVQVKLLSSCVAKFSQAYFWLNGEKFDEWEGIFKQRTFCNEQNDCMDLKFLS